MTRLFILFITIGLLASCRSTRQIQTAITKKDTTAVAITGGKSDSLQYIRTTLQKLQGNQISFKSFTGKLDVDYKGTDGKKYDVNANIRMLKDSAIWISATAILGIEGLRVLVTRDSIKVLDKINKVYTARSIDYLQDVTALPLDLPTLQNLIIGNAVFVDSNIVSFSSGNNLVSMLSIGQWFKNLVTVDPVPGTLQHSKLDDVNIARNRTAELIYADYETKKGFPFSTKRRIIVAEQKRLDITLDFKQYDFGGEVSFPFSVPKNYEQR